jgi:hypothetical protein
MERGNFSGNDNMGGNGWRPGDASSGFGSGQGLMFGHGFPPVNNGFRPGHDARAPYTGGDGGRFGGRDRSGGWAPHHRPTIGGRGGCGLGSFDVQMSGPNGRWDSRDR